MKRFVSIVLAGGFVLYGVLYAAGRDATQRYDVTQGLKRPSDSQPSKAFGTRDVAQRNWAKRDAQQDYEMYDVTQGLERPADEMLKVTRGKKIGIKRNWVKKEVKKGYGTPSAPKGLKRPRDKQLAVEK
ncbi:MAG: hypothetical protein AB1765_07320 [Candidatus Hydrogenedentota bacterium]